ncbi:MAG: flagellar basal body P-ring formation chaperone FlgA [Proteobacteria bacterium]|jgi:flagella basal body P-ring formation protein FlgA|nr:flagellar basal body P-ring formation chaperone FlgA [Pseudomonadota bacterium]
MKWLYFLILGSVSSWACEIQLPQRILVSSQATGASHGGSADCEANEIEEVYNVLREQSGNIPVARIQMALSKQIKLITTNSHIQIDNIERIIEGNFVELQKSHNEWKSELLGSYFPLDMNDQIEVSCHPCEFRGAEHFKLTVTQLGALKLSLDIPTRVFKLEEAIKVKSNLNAFSEKIDSGSWEVTKAPAINFGRYFNHPEKLKFYKTNKQLKAGDFIKESDLTPLNLVRAGDRIEITFENDHVKVKSQAVSRQNGGIDQEIEVWNQANGKKYKGVVTDFNRVTIRL